MAKIRATEQKSILRKDERKSNASGMIIPKNYQSKVQRGIVVDVGLVDKKDKWMKEGTTVYFYETSGLPVEFEGQEYLAIKNFEIYAYVEED